MTNYVLQITLQSPLTSASGEGRVGFVDRDIAYDDLGLPILPGRRLKGLWREAYRDVTDAWTSCQQQPTPAAQIFGESGKGPNEGEAVLYVGNAELEEVSALRPWLKYLQHHQDRKILTDDVIQHFSTVRIQTAMNRQTGVAQEDTLRLTRTLQSGLVFRSPVQFTRQPNKGLLNALAIGAAALQHMGTARTRGLGKVCCRLIEIDGSNQECDLTEKILKQASLPSITANQLPKVSSKQASGAPLSHSSIPTHLLRYRLTLTAPVVVPVADGDPNTVVTQQDIPGSHILGAAAWHYLRQTGHTPGDREFRHAFLDGGLRFLTAYPETVDTRQRMLPIPHSIRQFKERRFKEGEELVDLVTSQDKRPKKRLERRYAKLDQGSVKSQAVKTERNYHHARVSKDRRLGRALGAEIPDGGAFFQYEAIQMGEIFQGVVLGAEAALKNLQKWLKGINLIRLGRSRSAQYGEAKFEWIDDKGPEVLNKLVEWYGFTRQLNVDAPDLGNCLILTTLSPLLTVNEHGHPDASFPKHELARLIYLDANDLKLSCSYTRTDFVGGYDTHLRLPRQQWPAIAAGSVFVFELKQELKEEYKKRLVELESDGLGLRKSEGYGRIAINRLKLTDIIERQLDDLDNRGGPSVPGGSDIPERVRSLLKGVALTRCLTEMQQGAMNLTTIPGAIQGIPSNALLGRLRLFLQQDVPVATLNDLRRQAQEGLTNCRITRRVGMPWFPRSTTLYDLFKTAWTTPESLTEKLIQAQVENLVKDDVDRDYPNTRETLINELKADSKEMCKVFLNHLLTSLYRKLRT